MEPKVTNQDLAATAELLAAYLSARAAIEGVACELSEKLFLPPCGGAFATSSASPWTSAAATS